MRISGDTKDFIKINKDMLERLVNERLSDFKDASINLPTPEEREKARLLAQEFQYYLSIIKNIHKRQKKGKDFSGI